MNIQLITDIVSLVFIYTGAILVLATSIGLVRARNAMARIHFITKPQTAGLILTMCGVIIRIVGVGDLAAVERGDVGMIILLVMFTFLTSPVTGHRIGRVARREGLYDEGEMLVRDDSPGERPR